MIRITVEFTEDEAGALVRIIRWLDSAILARIFRPDTWGRRPGSEPIGTAALRKLESALTKEGIA